MQICQIFLGQVQLAKYLNYALFWLNKNRDAAGKRDMAPTKL